MDNQSNKITPKVNKLRFFSLVNRPKAEPSPSGKKVYEWDYLDKVGELKHDKRDVYQQIQSCEKMTDYKKLIKLNEKGEIDNNEFGFNDNDLFMDTTQLPGDFVDACSHISNCANIVDAIKQQQKQQEQNVDQNRQHVEQNGNQASTVSGHSPTIEQGQQGQQGGGNQQ